MGIQPSREAPEGTFLAENENRRTVGEASCVMRAKVVKELRPGAFLTRRASPHHAYRGGETVRCCVSGIGGKKEKK